MDVEHFNTEIWEAFRRLTPDAQTIKSNVERQFGAIKNDHVAFRALGQYPLNIENLEKPLLNMGYHQNGTYVFQEKKLFAKSYVMYSNTFCPRIFLSEPMLDQFSDRVRSIINKMLNMVSSQRTCYPSIFCDPTLFELSHKDYKTVLIESDYVAWVLANGITPNHFAIGLNDQCSQGYDVVHVLNHLESLGFVINDVGGRVKGSKETLLEQGSTMSCLNKRVFSDGVFDVATGFYEFVKRYPTHNKFLFDGFLEKNANNIFDSTNTRI